MSSKWEKTKNFFLGKNTKPEKSNEKPKEYKPNEKTQLSAIKKGRESIENHSEAVYSAVNSSIDIENKQHFILQNENIVSQMSQNHEQQGNIESVNNLNKLAESQIAGLDSNIISKVNSINTARPLKNLKWSAPSAELYKAAAKEAMQHTGGSFKFDNPNNEHELSTDKIVMQKLVDKGISPQRIKDVMKHSPQIEGKSPAEKAIKLQQFSKQLEKIPSLSRGLER